VQAFVDSLVESYNRVHLMMSHEDTIQMLSCLHKLSTCPAVTPTPNQSMLSNVQTLIINTIFKISPFHDNQNAWALVTEFSLAHLCKAIRCAPNSDTQVDKTTKNIFLASCSVAEVSIRSLYKMLEACEQPETKARIFGILVDGVQDLSIVLPRSLQEILTRIVEKQLGEGLAAFVQHPPQSGLAAFDHQKGLHWNKLAALIHSLLALHTSTAPTRGESAATDEHPNLGITLFSCVVKHVIPWAHSTPLSFNVSVLDSIQLGIMSPNRSYEWRHQCLAALFDLCRHPHQPDDECCLAVTREVHLVA